MPIRRQHADHLVAALTFIGLCSWCVVVISRLHLSSANEWRLAVCFAGALLAGQIVRRVLPALRMGAIAISAFVAHCVVFGVQAQLGHLPVGYQIALAIAVTQVGGVVGAVFARPRERVASVWFVLALGAVEFALFHLLGSIASVAGVPAGLFLMVGIVGGAALFVVVVSDLEHWQFGVAGAALVATVVLAIRTEALDEHVIGPSLISVALGIVGGLLGRNLRRRLKGTPELPPAELRK